MPALRDSRLRALAAGSLLTLCIIATPAAARILDGVVRIAVSVEIDNPVEGVTGVALQRRLAMFIADLTPGVTLDPAGGDRVRLAVLVRPHSSSALRGYYLPFSGTYAIGTVRLSIERIVELPGSTPRTVPAIVWQRERSVATRWAAAGAAVDGAVSEVLEDLATAVSRGR